MVDILRQKSILRQDILRQRAAMGTAARARASAAICRQLRALPAYRRARTVAAFAPMAEEPDIWPLLEDGIDGDKCFALPRVADRATRQLRFYRYRGRAALRAGFKGILEPPPADHDEILISSQTFDFLIIPAVGVDDAHRRLGYGGGFYDKVLVECLAATSCAPVFICQRRAVIPCEKHDKSITFIVSGRTR